MATIRSPKINATGTGQHQTDLIMKKQASVQNPGGVGPAMNNNLLTSKPSGQNTANGALTQIPSKQKFVQQAPLIQPPTSSHPPQYKLATPSQA